MKMIIAYCYRLGVVCVLFGCPAGFRADYFGHLNKRSAGRQSHAKAPKWSAQPAFKSILKRHNSFRPEFRRWRKLVALHAGELARYLERLPGGNLFDTGFVARVLRENGIRMPAEDPFLPWTNRWMGQWSNGQWQFHTWDNSCWLNGQLVQPVSLSESGFIRMDEAEKHRQRSHTDLAINVFSREDGITGWVSKVQHGNVEMPHIGYRLNATTLLWFCQVKRLGHEQTPDNLWLVFLETVDMNRQPPRYRIQGMQIRMDAKPGVQIIPGEHFGEYRAREKPAKANDKSA